MKIKKETILKEIQSKIDICKKYQETSPDPLAAARVELLDKNPCQDGKYYTVITYSAPKNISSTDLADLKKYAMQGQCEIPSDYISKVFIAGCIIKYDLKTQKVEVKQKTDYYQLMKDLFGYYKNKKCIIKKFEPTERFSLFSNINKFLYDDNERYKDNYESVVYSLGQFIPFEKSVLSKKFDKEIQQLSEFSHDLNSPSYINPEFKTSLEKQVNLEVGGTQSNINILNEVTYYYAKPTEDQAIKDLTNNKKFEKRDVFDLGEYFVKRIELLKKSDDKNYESRKISLTMPSSKYQLYKSLGGTEDWGENWGKILDQYRKFKVAIKNNKSVLQNAKLNDKYINNVKACEIAKYIISKNSVYIKFNYSEQHELLTIQTPLNGTGANLIAGNIFSSLFQDIKIVNVHSYDNFFYFYDNSNPLNYHQIKVLLDKQIDDTSLIKSTNNTYKFLFDEDTTYYEYIVYAEAGNIDDSNFRDKLSLDGLSYTYIENEISDQNRISKNIVNEGNLYDKDLNVGKKTESIPGKSYVCSSSDDENGQITHFFEANKLCEKLFRIKIKYELIPLRVDKWVKYIVEPVENKNLGSYNKETCEKIYQNYIKQEEELQKAYDKHVEEWEKNERKEGEKEAEEAYKNALLNKKSKEEAEKARNESLKETEKSILEEKQEQTRKSEYSRICIDTIDYDPWERLIEDLEKLNVAFSLLTPDKDGNLEITEDIKQKNEEETKSTEKKKEAPDIKLCDKMFPLDVLGILKWSGLGYILEKLGLYGVPVYVTNPDGNPASFLDIMVTLFNNCYRNDGLSKDEFQQKMDGYLKYDEDDMEIKWVAGDGFYENVILSLDYSAIKNDSTFNVEGSILSQFSSESDFKKFKTELKNLLDRRNGGEYISLDDELFCRNINIGISDGHAYIPTGKQITWVANMSTLPPKFRIWGCDDATTALLINAASKEGAEYVEEIEKFNFFDKIRLKPTDPLALPYWECYKNLKNGVADQSINELKKQVDKKALLDPWHLSKDAKKFLAYPYVPDPMVLLNLGGEAKDDVIEDEFDISYVYIPTEDTIVDALNNVLNTRPIFIDFDIYTKKMIQCGYPKEENPKCVDNKSNGKCGLEDLFKDPIILNSDFNFEDEIKRIKVHVTKKEIRNMFKETVSGLKSIANSINDYQLNLDLSKESMNGALNTLYEMGGTMLPLLQKLPPKCLTDALNSGKNAICATSRKVQDTSSIESFSDSAKHKLKTAGVLFENALNSGKKYILQSIKDTKSLSKNFVNALGKLWSNTSVYSLCPRRFKDHLKENSELNSVADGLKNMYQGTVLSVINNVLGNCFTAGITEDVVGNLKDLTNSQKTTFQNLVKNGDTFSLNKFISGNKSLKDQFNNGSFGFDFSKFDQLTSFNTNILTSIQFELMKKLNPMSITSAVTSNLMDPNFLKNVASSIITKQNVFDVGLSEQFKIGKQILSEFNGQGLGAVQSQTGISADNMKKIFNSSSSSDQTISQDIISSMQNYIKSKDEIYIKISPDKKSALNKDK